MRQERGGSGEEERATILQLYSANGGTATTSLGQENHSDDDEEEEDQEGQDYAKDWKKVAEVFDRLFFWLFLMAILISTLVLFHPLTDSYLKRWNEDKT